MKTSRAILFLPVLIVSGAQAQTVDLAPSKPDAVSVVADCGSACDGATVSVTIVTVNPDGGVNTRMPITVTTTSVVNASQAVQPGAENGSAGDGVVPVDIAAVPVVTIAVAPIAMASEAQGSGIVRIEARATLATGAPPSPVRTVPALLQALPQTATTSATPVATTLSSTMPAGRTVDAGVNLHAATSNAISSAIAPPSLAGKKVLNLAAPLPAPELNQNASSAILATMSAASAVLNSSSGPLADMQRSLSMATSSATGQILTANGGLTLQPLMTGPGISRAAQIIEAIKKGN